MIRRKKALSRISLVLMAIIPAIFSCSSGSATNDNNVASKISYALVKVGDPGNASDPLTGFGGVAYPFQIGKFDVTIGQYCTFLNAVARSDTYLLYNPNMATDLNSAGIIQSGSAGNYSYSVMNNGGNSANRPITYITWYSAARFTNWLANGQPQGDQNAATTENGAYNLNGAMSGNSIERNALNPNTGTAPEYFIPTHSEWVKAAYYSPTLNNGTGGYYLYATQSNSSPGNIVGSLPNQANIIVSTLFSLTQSADYFYAQQNYLTDVGAFSGSASYYGTFDQNGNVYQWNDPDEVSVPYAILAGAYWFAGSTAAQSTLYSTNALSGTDNGTGFRLVSLTVMH